MSANKGQSYPARQTHPVQLFSNEPEVLVRIACLNIQDFLLQAHIRSQPALQGTRVIVADESDPPQVIATSESAARDGVRPGISVAQARSLSPASTIVRGSAKFYRNTAIGLAQSLRQMSSTVEIEPGAEKPCSRHISLYVRAPYGIRGQNFGERLAARARQQGYTARCGIADEKFTAYIAARTACHKSPDEQLPLMEPAPACQSVPRGSSATFLAPHPLSFLPLEPELIHMLTSCGVDTLGDFAELPPPTSPQRWSKDDFDYRAAAKGQDTRKLVPFDKVKLKNDPCYEICERIAFTASHDPNRRYFLLRQLSERIGERLSGKSSAAIELQLTWRRARHGKAREQTDIVLHSATDSGLRLFEEIFHHLEKSSWEKRVEWLEVRVTKEIESGRDEFEVAREQCRTLRADRNQLRHNSAALYAG